MVYRVTLLLLMWAVLRAAEPVAQLHMMVPMRRWRTTSPAPPAA